MICCKIVTNYSNPDAHFSKLISGLAKLGDVKWQDNTIYFGSVLEHVDKKKVGSVYKKSGYKDFYVYEFNQQNPPEETDKSINGWLYGQICEICYQQYEDANQEVLRNVSRGIKQLDAQINIMREKGSKNPVNKTSTAKEDK